MIPLQCKCLGPGGFVCLLAPPVNKNDPFKQWKIPASVVFSPPSSYYTIAGVFRFFHITQVCTPWAHQQVKNALFSCMSNHGICACKY